MHTLQASYPESPEPDSGEGCSGCATDAPLRQTAIFEEGSLSPPRPTPVDITELLDRAAHDAMRVYPDLDVSLVPAPTVIIVGLPTGLRLAVDNAIANAVKHGGATRVQLSAVSSREGVEIAIDDDGVGVPEEERTVVFDRFSRGSTASHSGSGLGLALVAQQAELHGGTASLEASPLGGARLLLKLPPPS